MCFPFLSVVPVVRADRHALCPTCGRLDGGEGEGEAIPVCVPRRRLPFPRRRRRLRTPLPRVCPAPPPNSPAGPALEEGEDRGQEGDTHAPAPETTPAAAPGAPSPRREGVEQDVLPLPLPDLADPAFDLFSYLWE